MLPDEPTSEPTDELPPEEAPAEEPVAPDSEEPAESEPAPEEPPSVNPDPPPPQEPAPLVIDPSLPAPPVPNDATSLLNALQVRIDEVQELIVRHSEEGAKLIEESASLDVLAAKLREVLGTPPPPPPPPPPPDETPWWQTLGGPSLSGRPFRSGAFAVMGTALKSWATYMGHPPEISGGNCTGYGSGRWIADTWEKIAVQQADIANHPQTRDCVLGLNGLSKRTWLVLMFATLPLGATLDEMIASAKGKRTSYHKRLGENFRKALEKAGRDPVLTIGRPDWEGWGQDTARRIKAPGRIQNFLLAGGSIELDKDHMRAFAKAFWDGFGMEMPLAFSDAYATSPGVPRPEYGEWLKAGVYKLACGSFHPNADRVKTQDEAWRMVFGLRTGNYTPGLIIETAKQFKMPVAFLEHSCPPQESAVKPNIKNLSFSYTQFGKLCNDPASNVAFVCALGSGMVTEAKMKSMGEPINTQYAYGVKEHRKWFGKVL